MGIPNSTYDILASMGDDGEVTDSHRDNLANAVRNKDKDRLSELLDNSSDNDISWITDIAKDLLNSPVAYAYLFAMLQKK
jgi:hypothetical protein